MTQASYHCPFCVDVRTLAALFDTAPDVAFFVKDATGRYITVNNSLVIRHGKDCKSDVIGKKPSDICQGEFGELPAEQDEEVLRTGQPILEHLEMQWSCRKAPVWCLTTKLPISDEQGRIVGIVGFSRDVRVTVPADQIPEEFARALQEFEQTLSKQMTPAKLAEQSGMTPQQLIRFTKRIFELTPSQLITKIRIAGASKLLCNTDMSVAEIAFACGFYDHSAFARAFRNATNATPSEFREGCK